MESYYLIPNSEFIKAMTESFPDENENKIKAMTEYIVNVSNDFSCCICVTHPIFFDIHLMVISEGRILKSVF